MRSLRCAALALAAIVAACGAVTPGPAPAPPQSSTSQVAVQALQEEYLNKFLTPATAYVLLPRCPQAAPLDCSDPAIVAKLKAAEQAAHNALFSAQSFTDAVPSADATGPLAAARAALTAAEQQLPGAT